MDAEAIAESVSISDYIGQYCEFQERNGDLWCLSPLTNERTPSFSITPDKNLFYDFSSGKGGNIITFIKLYHKVSHEDAVKMAAKFAGIDLDAEERQRFESTKSLKRLSKLKPLSPDIERTFLVPDVMARYPFDEEKIKLWIDEGIGKASLEKFEVKYDPASERIIYPIKDIDGNILTIQGRTTDPFWKDKRIPKYISLSKWGNCSVLYGLFENRQAIKELGEVIVFEGAKSVMLCDTWGIPNTVAALTSHLNEYQLRLLIGMGVKVIVAFDKEIDPRKDINVQKLMHFVPVLALTDRGNRLSEKMAPVDAGLPVFGEIYANKERLN